MKKTICFNISSIYARGGEERICTMLANNLVEKGYDVHIVSLYADDGLKPFFEISEEVKLFNLLPTKTEKRIHAYLHLVNYAERKYRRYLQRNHVDVIIDVETTRTCFTAPAVRDVGIKHIAWEHFAYPVFEKRGRCKETLEYIRKDVDKLVVLTNQDAKDYVHKGNVPVEKIVKIPNFSAFEESEYVNRENKKVLFVGRLDYQKGTDLLLDVWALVEQECREWTLEIVGDGIEKESLMGKKKELNLKNIEFTPATQNIKEKYESASIFVLPSRTEGFGLVLLEASNMSLPLIAFDCANGPREIINDGNNGYLVSEGDTQLMAQKLLLLMKDGFTRKRMSISAFNTSKSFEKKKVINQWMSIIESILHQ